MMTGAATETVPGAVIEVVVFPVISREWLQHYAEVSGDTNQIHLNDAVAQSVGLPGIIAHGMLIAGLIAERALRFVQAQNSNYILKRFQTRFKAMTFLGDIPSVGGVVKSANDQTLVIELQAKNQRGEVVSVGTAWFVKKELRSF